KAYILDVIKRRSAAVADQYRERLVALYGKERADKVKYAEAFQLGQYGRQASVDELKQMFPRVQQMGMTIRLQRLCIALALIAVATFVASAEQPPAVTNVFLVTMDGMRWQEGFGGLQAPLGS